MMAQDRAAAREADQQTDRADQPSIRNRVGAMALQSGRGYEAAPQAFVRLTGSHLAKPRVSRALVTE
jgi:predicted chitinase